MAGDSKNQVGAMSFRESPLIHYSNNWGNPGIYLEWERYTTSGVDHYNILRSTHFDGPYEEIDSVEWPVNEYVDANGSPTSYYKIEEVADNDSVLSTSAPMTGDEMLLKSSLRYELLDLLNVPIYDEEVLWNGSRTKANVALPYWNYTPRPEVRITGPSEQGDRDAQIVLSEYDTITNTTNSDTDNYPDGLKIALDYQGAIHFLDENNEPVSIHPYDTVNVSYSIRLFTGAQMNSALNMALQAINAQPGASKFATVASAPFYYDPAIVYGATYYLLRQLLTGLNQRQKRLVLQDPENGAYDTISKLTDVAKMYKEDFDAMLKSLPLARLPRIGAIVTPEYNLPGGRSRMFRYMFSSSSAN